VDRTSFICKDIPQGPEDNSEQGEVLTKRKESHYHETHYSGYENFDNSATIFCMNEDNL
jgi:hypothetical protein